jgi:hypothetical protein
MAYSVLFAWLYNGSQGSLLLVAVFHASLSATENTLKQVLPVFRGDGVTTITYGCLVLALAVAITLVCGPARLTRAPGAGWAQSSRR